MEVWKDERKEGWMDVWKDERKEGLMEVWKDERRMNHRGMHGKMSGDMFEKINEFNLEKNYCAEEGRGGGEMFTALRDKTSIEDDLVTFERSVERERKVFHFENNGMFISYQ